MTRPPLPDGPLKDQVYTDYTGRVLRVTQVSLGDPGGREVIGVMLSADGVERDYSCTFDIWARIWRDKEKPADRSKMTHG